MHISFSSWKWCSDVCTPHMSKVKQIKPWVKRLRNGVVLGEGFLAMPPLVLRISLSLKHDGFWFCNFLTRRLASPWAAVCLRHFCREWLSGFNLKETWLWDCAAKTCRIQNSTSLRCTKYFFLPLVRSAFYWNGLEDSSNFYMSSANANAEQRVWSATVGKLSTKSLRSYWGKDSHRTESVRERKCQKSGKGQSGWVGWHMPSYLKKLLQDYSGTYF